MSYEQPAIGSACSGYGGLDMAAVQLLGGRVAWHVEHNADASRILEHHWPDVPNHHDVKSTDWTTVEPVDVLTAGYPCQPFSHAGRRGGENDPRHLWPDILHAIRTLRPRLVLLENVFGHLTLGFGTVLGDLAAAGFDAEWCVLRASDLGAPHGRARLFIAATDAARDGRNEGRPEPARLLGGPHAPVSGDAPADPDGGGLESLRGELRVGRDADGRGRQDTAWGPYEPAIRRWERVLGRRTPRPTEPSGSTGRERLSPRFVEWLMGLPDGHVTDPAIGISRNAQLTALGNGVVPQQAVAAYRVLLDHLRAIEAAA